MSNNCTTNHAIIFFFILSLLLVHNHDFFSSPSKPTRSKPTHSSCSCKFSLLLAFISGVLFTILCILNVRFPVLLIAPLRSTVSTAFKFLHSSPPPAPADRRHPPTGIGGGISASMLKTLPIFDYCAEKRLKLGKGGGECAICLSEFLNEQTLRWLPECDHLFHRRCIDAWLESHKTCPCCRKNVEVENSGPEMRGLESRRDLDAACERSVVAGVLRLLTGRRRQHTHRQRRQ